MFGSSLPHRVLAQAGRLRRCRPDGSPRFSVRKEPGSSSWWRPRGLGASAPAKGTAGFVMPGADHGLIFPSVTPGAAEHGVLRLRGLSLFTFVILFNIRTAMTLVLSTGLFRWGS